MKRGLQYFFSCLVICAFAAVITADYWRNPNLNPVVLVELEPKKNSKDESNPKDDFNEKLKEKPFLAYAALSFDTSSALSYSTFYTLHLPKPHLSLPELPPELV